ncbi:CHAT domain-containing protein [Kitasatospora sp. NPDC001574]
MGFFASRRIAEYEKVTEAVRELQRLGRREGTAAAADGSWKLMRHCFDRMARGRAWYAPMTLRSAQVSFGMHAELGQWFVAACSSLSFAAAVALMDAECTRQGTPFPEEVLPDMQMMAEMSVDVAHRAQVPLVGYLVAEALTGLQMGDRTIVREATDLLGAQNTVERLRALRHDVGHARKQARIASKTTGIDTVAALRVMADAMLADDLDKALDRLAKGHLLSGSNTASALLASVMTARSVVYVAPGVVAGAAIRLNAPGTGRDLCESVALPGLRATTVRDRLDTLGARLAVPARGIRDRAVRDVHAFVREAVWEPLLGAWPDLVGARVALVPLGESARLPLYTAPADDSGIPACGLMDLTVAPSGNALMFASAWPRPSRLDPLVVADPWFEDGEGFGPMPFTVPEARQVAAAHGVEPLLYRQDADTTDGDGDGDRDDGEGEGERLNGPGGSPAPPGARKDGAAAPELAGLLTSANLIHLGGHGVLDPTRPLDSAVLLGERLPLSALLGHDLRRGTTVVLSACHLAGIGTRTPGEQLGFPAAMLAMGASTVVAGLWAIPDSEEAVTLMTGFHQDLARGTSPSAAFGRAVARAAADGARPTLWGAFTHFGA